MASETYEGDMRDIVTMIDKLKGAQLVSDLYIREAQIRVYNLNDYEVGMLYFDHMEDAWKFAPTS